MVRRIKTIDAHAAGEPLRLIVDGFPSVDGATMLEKRERLRSRHDRLRRALMLEPRGHADMYGALLTEPVTSTSHAGVLFMHNEGYSTMCGHGVIAVVTIALERGLITVPDTGAELVLDTPAGPVRARARIRAREVTRQTESGTEHAVRVESVSFINVPSFVFQAGLLTKLAGREVRVDVAFGGAFYAIVDSEAVGIPLERTHLPELRRAGMAIKRAVESATKVQHPIETGLKGIYGTIFTGPAHNSEADLRNVTVFADAQVDRSPCGTGTSAVMAVLDAMQLLSPDRPFIHESVIGMRFAGRIAGRTAVGDHAAIIPEIEGSASITGEHTFLIDDEDPLRDGFRL